MLIMPREGRRIRIPRKINPSGKVERNVNIYNITYIRGQPYKKGEGIH